MGFEHRHLLGLRGLRRDELEFLLETASSFREISERDIKKVPTLRGKTVVSFFHEDSTRTRTSFEIAAKRMSADFISLSGSTSSVNKGETLLDTARNLAAMRPDAIIMRHASSGAAHFLAERVGCAIINAGDGTNEHPTQALLDALTIQTQKGSLEGLEVAIIGDIAHSRVARSNTHCLTKLGARIRFAGPPTLMPPELSAWGRVCRSLREAVAGADVVMMLRVQRERQATNYFPSLDEYSRYFCLTPEALREAKPDAIVMHPGPINRGVEISSQVADGPQSVIMDQVTNGIAVRMAVLYLLVNRPRLEAELDVAGEGGASVRSIRRVG